MEGTVLSLLASRPLPHQWQAGASKAAHPGDDGVDTQQPFATPPKTGPRMECSCPLMAIH